MLTPPQDEYKSSLSQLKDLKIFLSFESPWYQVYSEDKAIYFYEPLKDKIIFQQEKNDAYFNTMKNPIKYQ